MKRDDVIPDDLKLERDCWAYATPFDGLPVLGRADLLVLGVRPSAPGGPHDPSGGGPLQPDRRQGMCNIGYRGGSGCPCTVN